MERGSINQTIEINNAKITDISEVSMTGPGVEYLLVYIANERGISGRFFIYRNSKKNFDIIRQFERGIFNVGDEIRFSYRKSRKGFNYIIKMKHMK